MIAHTELHDIAAERISPFGRKLALTQGAYFLVTGIWPLLSIRTFQKITGPKHDLWLVKTVGVLVGVIGLVITLSGVRGRATTGERLLAVGSAAGLAAIDVVYVLRGRILPVYLLDALLELAIIAGWIVESEGDKRWLGSAAGTVQGGHPMGQGYY